MASLITPGDFDKFKAYARRLLNDFTQAHVGPYIHNEALQEIMVTWGERARKGITEIYPKPENITALDTTPYVSPIEAGAYDVKSLVKRFMEHAGFRETPEFTSIAGMSKGRFDIKITDDYDDSFLSSIDSLAIRVNGDLGAALKSLHEMDDATLDAVCRKALKKTNILIQPSQPG
jgi:hypothetical protein